MNGLGLAATLASLAAMGPVFGGFGDRGKQPQPFDEKVTLPGKIPATAKSLSGAWQYGYQLDNADLEGGKSDLISGLTLMLREDGTYQLEYHARWNLPAIPLPGAIPKSWSGMDGLNVSEEGRFSLSGEVLLLEPATTRYADVDDNTMVNQQTIGNETHALIVRLNKAHLSVAGRCASYQVDPVCRKTPIVWYPMKAQLGTRWLPGSGRR